MSATCWLQAVQHQLSRALCVAGFETLNSGTRLTGFWLRKEVSQVLPTAQREQQPTLLISDRNPRMLLPLVERDPDHGFRRSLMAGGEAEQGTRSEVQLLAVLGVRLEEATLLLRGPAFLLASPQHL